MKGSAACPFITFAPFVKSFGDAVFETIGGDVTVAFPVGAWTCPSGIWETPPFCATATPAKAATKVMSEKRMFADFWCVGFSLVMKNGSFDRSLYVVQYLIRRRKKQQGRGKKVE
jgi:hypothetical protein